MSHKEDLEKSSSIEAGTYPVHDGPYSEKDVKDSLPSNQIVGDDVAYVTRASKEIDLDEAREILRKVVTENALDPNFPAPLLRRAQEALQAEELSHDVASNLMDEIRLQAALMDDSPYAEVRAVVPNTDDPSIPSNTFRVWVLGLTFAAIGAGINTFFAARAPSIGISVFSAQLLAFPIAKLMEKVLPTTKFNIFGQVCSLNPGPFNQKEHMLITIMSNVTFGGVYVTDLFVVLRLPLYFNDNATGASAGFQILSGLSTQLMGYSVAGLSRRFLVYPPSMIWPSNLAQIALNKSFHNTSNPVANGWKIAPYRFFLYVFVGYGLYFLLPDVLFGALSQFNWPTWIAPMNVGLAIWLGSSIGGAGLGLNPIPTFDYNWLGMDPLITPLFSYVNVVAGMIFFGLPAIAGVYYTNAWNTGYLPTTSNILFDRMGSRYNVSKILDENKVFSAELYEAYSPAYWGPANVLVYFWFFAFYTSSIVHAGLYHWRPIVEGFRAMKDWRNPQTGYNDLHNRLMRAYPEVPEWWFATVGAVSLIFGIVFNEVYHTAFPVWALFVCVLLSFFFVIPAGMITAVSNVQLTLNVISELIGGFALPGKPIAVMLFKSYGLLVTNQAITYSADLKLGHYLKINPKHQFWVQTIGTIWAVFVSIGVIDWQIKNIPDLCTKGQKNHFTCPGYNTFFSAAVIWGVIGPKRIYGQKGIYHQCTYGFLLGALLPIPFYYAARRFPTSFLKYVHAPVLISGPINFAPYNLSNYLPGLWICLAFNGYIKRRYLPWWTKYNYILATGLGSSIGLFGIVYFFIFQYTSVGDKIVWWGNNVPYLGCDAAGCALLTIPDDGFGPAPGEFKANP